MTKAELDAIRARAEAATPGPWSEIRVGGHPAGLLVKVEKEWFDADDDANFIIHARTDIPLLIAEVGRLQAELFKEEVVSHTKVIHASLSNALDVDAYIARLEARLRKEMLEADTSFCGVAETKYTPEEVDAELAKLREGK